MRKLKNLSKLELVRIIRRLKNKERSHLFQFLDNDAIDTLGECVHNVLFNNINLKKASTSFERTRFGSCQTAHVYFVSCKCNTSFAPTIWESPDSQIAAQTYNIDKAKV